MIHNDRTYELNASTSYKFKSVHGIFLHGIFLLLTYFSRGKERTQGQDTTQTAVTLHQKVDY